MTIEELIAAKAELGYTNEQLSDASGIPASTLQKIFSGVTKAPRRATLTALSRAMEKLKRSEARGLYTDSGKDMDQGLLREPRGIYGDRFDLAADPLKKSTLDDYLALPDDLRVELIDGIFYDMAAPTSGHQAIGGYIHKLLLDHVIAKGGKCLPLMSPLDVQLDQDDYTVVQPDVVIVCDRKKFRNGRVFGAPDFVAEVLSPSTRKKDMFLKLKKYCDAGVREYWMIDPLRKAVVVYDLENEGLPALYGFEDQVPVRIWNGECVIDFAAIYQFMGFLLD